MKVKQVKNKTFLPDELILENYIINNNGVIPQNETSIKEQMSLRGSVLSGKNIQLSPKVKPKSAYILFVQETTNKLKNKKPNMTPKVRKEEVSRLWKLEKSK
jgi:hypothetical protein